jgi:hypothetical protein
MHSKRNALTQVLGLAACAVLALVTAAQAEDKKADPTGTWTWSTPGRNGGPDRVSTLTLKLEGDKLTGKMTTPGRGGGPNVETEITDGKVKGDEVSFTVTREFNDNKIVSKYAGKLGGDSIKGKVNIERNGEAQEPRDWEAKREKADKDKAEKKM